MAKTREVIRHVKSPALVRENEGLRSRLSRLREFGDRKSGEIVDLAVTAAGAYVAGAYQHRIDLDPHPDQATPATLMDMDWRLTWGAAGVLIGREIKGETGRLLRHASLGVMCAGAAEAGSHSTMLLPHGSGSGSRTSRSGST
jgi:hypothetical protein